MKKQFILVAFAFLLSYCSDNKEVIAPENNSNDLKSVEFSTIEFIEIGGVDQAIKVNGNDLSKPVLLVLHGGPGYAMLPLFHMSMPELEDHYIVVNWDQRGGGRSYSSSIPSSSMTLSQQVQDAHELTEILKERFNKEKIYILGHSWGTVLGIELISDYPEDYIAYIGVGQVINVIKNEQQCYKLTLAKAIEENNQNAINQLTAIGEPSDYGYYENEYNGEDGWDITNKWMEKLGGSLYGKSSSDEVLDYFLVDEVYINNINQWSKGFDFSQYIFEDSNVWYFNFAETHLNFSVPVYFFTGQHDFETPYTLVEEYYNAIKSDNKHLVWFENSAHFPFFEETTKFVHELIEVSNQ
jgi:pimeloyl-ACP methyl ester carboxylesterase